MEANCIIGIDNGLDGGLVALRPDGEILDMMVMPTIQQSKRVISIHAVANWANDIRKSFGQTVVALEEPLHAAGSSQSLRSMSISFGKLFGGLSIAGFTVKEVEVGEWHTRMIGRGPKGTSKVRALAAAKKQWSDQTWIPPRCRTPHDGLVDAALIGLYYATHRLKNE
jgi:hypothetical protein